MPESDSGRVDGIANRERKDLVSIISMVQDVVGVLRMQRYNETTTATTCISTNAY